MPKILTDRQFATDCACRVIDAFANASTVWTEDTDTDSTIAMLYNDRVVLIAISVEKGE